MADTVAAKPSPVPRGSRIHGFLKTLAGRNSSANKTLSRKLVSARFPVLQQPLSPDATQHHRRQLQRILDISVLEATRDKKKQLVMTLKMSLKPTTPREQVGIFVPNNSPVTYKTTITFRDVSQLSKVLSFYIDRKEGGCRENCEFCSQLRTYLSNHWVRDPLVTVINMGDTVLRKPSLAMHLARLVTLANGKNLGTPHVVRNKGVALVQLVPPCSNEKKVEGVHVCAAQNDTTAVLYNFFGIFPLESAVANSSPKPL